MTNEKAQIIIGNIPVYGDENYSIAEYQEAKAMAISALSTDGEYIKKEDALNQFDSGLYSRDYVHKTINDLPTYSIPDSAEHKGEWIPIAERIPEMGIYVLCACQANIYDVLKLTPDGWFYDTRHIYMLGFVKAWQPLPEPYKAESEDKE